MHYLGDLHGPVVRLLAGAPLVLQVDCSGPGRARALLAGTGLGARADAAPSALGLEITLPAGTGRGVIAESTVFLSTAEFPFTGEAGVVEPGAAQVNVLEPGSGQILAGEVSHPASFPDLIRRS